MAEKNDEKDPVPLMTRLFRACLLLFAAVVVLWLALQLLAQFWGWLLVIAAIAGLIWGAIWYIRWRRDRGW